ncbi:ABC transporter ATP-binding protein [Echinicola sediminis]
MENEANILQGKGISIGYRKGKSFHTVAEDLSFGLKKGKLTCLLGPNGVGKSTLIKTVMGQIPSLSGKIDFLGSDIKNHSTKFISKKISVVLTDKVSAGNLSVHQLVSLGRTPFTNWLGKLTDEDQNIVDKALRVTKTHYLKDQLISEVSDGQLQKVMIARALAQDGELIILDEPTAHLDLINRYEIMHLLREITERQGKSILVITHDLEIAIETADELWIMQCGEQLLVGPPEDLIINGDINRLIPGHQLTFDPELGKIRPFSSYQYKNIEGPSKISQWLKLALEKNHLELPESIKITASSSPALFKVQGPDFEKETGSIHEVISFLKEHI